MGSVVLLFDKVDGSWAEVWPPLVLNPLGLSPRLVLARFTGGDEDAVAMGKTFSGSSSPTFAEVGSFTVLSSFSSSLLLESLKVKHKNSDSDPPISSSLKSDLNSLPLSPLHLAYEYQGLLCRIPLLRYEC